MNDWMAYVHKGEAEIVRLRALVRYYWEPSCQGWKQYDLNKALFETFAAGMRKDMKFLQVRFP